MPSPSQQTEAKRLFAEGNAFLGERDWLGAISSYRRALAENPLLGEALANIGYCFEQLGQQDEAATAYREALGLSPQSSQIAFNLGNVLRKERRFAEAAQAYERALGIDPENARCLNNLGMVLQAQGLTDRALACYGRAIRARPDYAEAHNNQGTALLALNDVDGALRSYRRALQIDPTLERARGNEALALLVSGDMTAGWRGYEGRPAHPEHLGRTLKRWRGDFSLEGKSILLTWEQGFGDTLQFARFAPMLARRGITVHLEVQPALKALLGSLRGVASVIASGCALPEVDATCPLMSVPHALGLGVDDLRGEVPYLTPGQSAVSRWLPRLRKGATRVGVVWPGSPAHSNDRWRSIPPRAIADMLEGAKVHALSLQKSPSRADRESLSGTGIDLGFADEFSDFEATAGLISHLDLVITVDTAVAHLAGAMGKPVWILLPFSPDWRWLLNRTDSPWYPSARLFRQARPGDWTEPLARVRAMLLEHIAKP